MIMFHAASLRILTPTHTSSHLHTQGRGQMVATNDYAHHKTRSTHICITKYAFFFPCKCQGTDGGAKRLVPGSPIFSRADGKFFGQFAIQGTWCSSCGPPATRFIHTYIHMYMYAHIYIYAHAYVHVCTCIYACIHIYVYVYTCMYICMIGCMCVFVHRYVRSYVHM